MSGDPGTYLFIVTYDKTNSLPTYICLNEDKFNKTHIVPCKNRR